MFLLILQFLPDEIAEYIHKSGDEPWIFRGPSMQDIKCFMQAPKDKAYASIGAGWLTFCQQENLKAGDIVVLKFTNATTRIVHVDVRRFVA